MAEVVLRVTALVLVQVKVGSVVGVFVVGTQQRNGTAVVLGRALAAH